MTQLHVKHFDAEKAGQLAFYFLNRAGETRGNITKLRLVKWLYLAERASYEEFGEPLVWDRIGAMRHGPAPSETVALLEGKRSWVYKKDPFSDILSVHRENRHQYVSLQNTCPYSSADDLDRFSEAEIELLDSVWEKYGRWSATRLEKHLHDVSLFPEWNWKEGDGTNWVDLETMLKVVGFPDQEIPSMVNRILAFATPHTGAVIR